MVDKIELNWIGMCWAESLRNVCFVIYLFVGLLLDLYFSLYWNCFSLNFSRVGNILLTDKIKNCL